MHSETEHGLLFDEFPELCAEGVLLQKEVLAHFGLLFSGYALLEAAVQNCYIFWQLHVASINSEIHSQDDWEARHEVLERKAFSATFGTLLRIVSDCPDLTHQLSVLQPLKRKRDYFAHRFFREGNDKMFSDAAALRLISRMNILRREVKEAEVSIDAVSYSIIKRMYPQTEFDSNLIIELERMKSAAKQNSKVTFGWEEIS